MGEWFQEWFGEEYLRLYPHRDDRDARELLALLRRTLPWRNDWRILDIACGAGRHLAALVREGARPIGLDLSAALLRRARAATDCPLIRADMRQLPIRPGSIDLGLNLFTSFGYFESDREHAQALGEMLAAIVPGGWFAIDFLNPTQVRATLVPAESRVLGGAAVQIQRTITDDDRFVVKTIRTADGQAYRERVRLLTAPELRAMIEPHGFVVRYEFGDYAGNGPGTGHRTILVCQRNA